MEMKAFVVVCGWCADAAQKTLAAKAQGHTVSHGICGACVVKFEELAEA